MKKKSIVLVIIVGALVICGCSKNFLNVNTNPNYPTTADPALVFTNAGKKHK